MYFQVDTDQAIWKIIDGEAVMVHADSSEYFGLNASGTVLWQVLATSTSSTEQLAVLLAERFDRESAGATLEVTAFVDKAVAAGLIAQATPDESDAGPTSAPDTTTPQTSGPYEPPELVKFGDLATLVLSGE